MAFSDRDIPGLVTLLQQTGADEIMPRFRQTSDADLKQKSAAWDVVTEADVAAERVIEKALGQIYPGAQIIGEEAAAGNPGVLDGLGDAALAFVIDPIDGTYNFASGMPTFGTMLAVIVNGECIAGLIHYPVGGETVIGLMGAGSRLLDGAGIETPIKVADPVPLNEMVGTVSWGMMKGPERRTVAGNLAKIGMPFAFRCSAWEYRLAATGRAHFISAQHLMPWDHLAGVLIHAEAGGYTACLDGKPYRPGKVEGGLITACDQEVWGVVRREIFGLSDA
ncbi:MAG: inositol monophosphatase [Pseudomonadota bacterium]